MRAWHEEFDMNGLIPIFEFAHEPNVELLWGAKSKGGLSQPLVLA